MVLKLLMNNFIQVMHLKQFFKYAKYGKTNY